jgi:hypothetical protein
MIVGPTEPKAIDTKPSSLSRTRQADAVEITIALRVPTFA